MKKREIAHWTKNEYLKGMLLFAQALEEETFNYSYESYRVPLGIMVARRKLHETETTW